MTAASNGYGMGMALAAVGLTWLLKLTHKKL